MLNFVKNDTKEDNKKENKEENQKINIKHKKIIITGKRKLIFFKINTIKNNN
jgi:uncharacterized protein with PIN domain